MPVWLIRLLHSFLSDRSFSVKYKHAFSAHYYIQAGIPKWSHLSPFLFIMFINDTPKNPSSHLVLFADDTDLYVISNTLSNLRCSLQKHLDAVVEHFNTWKLSINSAKTQAIVSSNKGTPPLLPTQLQINGHNIVYSSQAKY